MIVSVKTYARKGDVNGVLGHNGGVLIDGDGFGGEERPRVKVAGQAGVLRLLSATGSEEGMN